MFTLLKLIFTPFRLALKILKSFFGLLTNVSILVDGLLGKVEGVLAVLLISAIIVGAFKLYDKIKGQKEDSFGSADEPFTSYYQQQK